MAGFIAVGILADKPRNIGLGASGSLLRGGEEGVQARLEGFRAAKGLYEPRDVVGHEETVLPGVCLRVVVVYLAGVEGREPSAIKARPHELCLRIKDVFPVLGTFHKLLILCHMAKPQGNLRHAPIVKGILKGLGHGFVLVIGQDKAVTAEAVKAEFPVAGACQHGLEGVFIVKAWKAAEDGIGNHRGGVVAYHAVGLVAGEFPDRKFAGFVVDGEHGPYEIHRAFRFNFRQKRMKAPEGIPEGENGVAVPAIGLMNQAVHAAILSVYV